MVYPLLGYRHAVFGAYPFALALMMVLCAACATLITHGAVLGEITVMYAVAEGAELASTAVEEPTVLGAALLDFFDRGGAP